MFLYYTMGNEAENLGYNERESREFRLKETKLFTVLISRLDPLDYCLIPCTFRLRGKIFLADVLSCH